MSRRVRKLLKLWRSPGIFLRDALLNRYPLGSTADVNKVRKFDAPAERPCGEVAQHPLSHQVPFIQGAAGTDFPVDVVFTWVDFDDPAFQQSLRKWTDAIVSSRPDTAYEARFKSRDELRFSIRSVLRYAPWVRTIYVVTNGQAPRWLRLDSERVKLVRHSDIIPERYLPTFNSHVIESCIHRIPSLAENYIYFNDDVFLLRPVKKWDFFNRRGQMYAFISSARVPNGPLLETDTPSIWAAKNARNLLYNRTGYYIDHKIAHTYHPQLKSVAADNERDYAEAFHACRSNRIRARNDILCSSYLTPYSAYVAGKAVLTETKAWYFSIRDLSARHYYQALMDLKNRRTGPYSVCLNDHWDERNSSVFTDYETYLSEFLTAYFSETAEHEFVG